MAGITEVLTYYRTPGSMTTFTHPSTAGQLSDDIPALVQQIRGLVIHVFWYKRMGAQIPEQRRQEVELRHAGLQLQRILELNGSPLNIVRPAEERLVGNCRDFSTFMAAVLRRKGIPARARCGFACYFRQDHYEDHWVCEVWDSAARAWLLVDAQLDAFQRNQLEITFSPLDVPRDQFLTAGHAWQLCREKQADPQFFGIFDMRGMWFVRGNVIRDFLALNKVELLPWDSFGLIAKKDGELTGPDLALLDRIAGLTTAMDSSFAEIRSLITEEKSLDPAAFLSAAGSSAEPE